VSAPLAVPRLPRLFTSRDWMEDAEPAHLLWPFWGASHWEPRYSDLYADFMVGGRQLFELTEIAEDADFFLPPCGWQQGGSRQALRMADLATRHGRPLLLFFNSDSDEPIPIANAIIYRTSFTRSSRSSCEHSWPAWTCDILKTYGGGRIIGRATAPRPTIGYCGYVDYRNVFEHLQRALRGQIGVWGRIRGTAVRTLAAARGVDCRFVLRRRFAGRAAAAEREEYARIMLGCDYALVARGKGNFSFRLYEAMSAGAIPVFIDSDCCLPFDDVIPYRELFVWVPEDDIGCVAEYLLRFHAQHDGDSLVAHRRRIRQVYDTYLAPLAFHREVSARLASATTAAGVTYG